jgi:hypothetical protein
MNTRETTSQAIEPTTSRTYPRRCGPLVVLIAVVVAVAILGGFSRAGIENSCVSAPPTGTTTPDRGGGESVFDARDEVGCLGATAPWSPTMVHRPASTFDHLPSRTDEAVRG